MDRRAFISGMTVGLLAAPLGAEAQQAGKVWRIGLLDYASDPASSSRWKALRDRLRELGYVEGQNVLFESRWGGGRSRLPDLAAELVNAKVDIIVTAGSESAAAVKQATSQIPIVLATGGDLVGLGVVGSRGPPGGKLNGVV
jgi:putative ABC transport system substrate-binding protein